MKFNRISIGIVLIFLLFAVLNTVVAEDSLNINSLDGDSQDNGGIVQLSSVVGDNATKFKENITVFGSPVISNGTVYANSPDGNLYAYSSNGTLKWKYQTSSSIINSPAVGKSGTIYVLNWENMLYAINPNGTLKWQYNGTGTNFGSSPMTDNSENIYFTSKEGNIFSVNVNGELRWTRIVSEALSPAVGHFRYDTPVLGPNGNLYLLVYFDESQSGSWWIRYDGEDTDAWNGISNYNLAIVSLNATNGRVIWQTPLDFFPIKTGFNQLSIGADGTIYLTNNRFSENDSYSKSGGTNFYYKPPLAFYYDNFNYTTSVYAFFPNGTLKYKWGDNSTGEDIFGRPYVTSNGTLYIVYSNKLIALYNGVIQWEFDHGGVSNGYQTPVVDSGGTIYIGSNTGLYAINSDGTLKWKKETGPVSGSVVIDSDGTIYFADNKYLYAIGKVVLNFTYNVTNLEVKFNSTNNGNDLEYLWDFGDGTNSTEKNPVHIYESNGNYTVTFKAYNEYEYTVSYIVRINDTKIPQIIVNLPEGTYNGTIYLNISLDEKGYIYYTLNNATPFFQDQYLYDGSLIMINKTTTLKIRAMDTSGNPTLIHILNYIINPVDSTGTNNGTDNNNGSGGTGTGDGSGGTGSSSGTGSNGGTGGNNTSIVGDTNTNVVKKADLVIVSAVMKNGVCTFKIKNNGKKVSQTTQLMLYHSAKNYKIVNVSKIASGKIKTIRIKFDKNLNNKVKYAIVNFHNKAVESNYDNNMISFKTKANKIKKGIKSKNAGDLIIKSTAFKNGYCTFKVKNQGKKTSKATKLLIFYNMKNHKVLNVPKISSGKTKIVKVKFNKKLANKNKYAIVNFHKIASESNFDNNIVIFKNKITKSAVASTNGNNINNSNSNINNNANNINTKIDPNSPPDLIITKIERVYLAEQYPDDIRYVNNTVYNITVKNIGGKTAGASSVKMTLPQPLDVGKHTPAMNSYCLANFGEIKGGESESTLMFFFNSMYQLNYTTGVYQAKIVEINHDRNVVESDYDNNRLSFTDNYYKYLPDLTIVDVKRSGNTYSITIKNIGAGDADASKVLMWYSETKTKVVDLPQIAVDTTYTIDILFFDYNEHKDLYKYLNINYDKRVTESSYDNNVIKFKI